MDYDTGALLTSIRNRAALPDFSLFQESDLLAFATEELREKAFPFIMALRSDFGLVSADTALSAAEREYPLPVRAHGGKLRAAKLMKSDGSTRPLPIHAIEAVLEQLVTEGAYIEGDNLVFTSAPTSGDTLRMSYYLRPSKLVDVSEGATVVAVEATSATEVLVTLLNASNVIVGTGVDAYSSQPNFGMHATDLVVSVGGDPLTQRTLTGTGAAKVRVGDVLTLAGTAIIPHLPAEAHGYLAHLVVARVMESMGDERGLAAATEEIEEAEARLRTLFAPRTEGDTQTLVNRTMLGV
jgi:hypothetical protein